MGYETSLGYSSACLSMWLAIVASVPGDSHYIEYTSRQLLKSHNLVLGLLSRQGISNVAVAQRSIPYHLDPSRYQVRAALAAPPNDLTDVATAM